MAKSTLRPILWTILRWQSRSSPSSPREANWSMSPVSSLSCSSPKSLTSKSTSPTFTPSPNKEIATSWSWISSVTVSKICLIYAEESSPSKPPSSSVGKCSNSSSTSTHAVFYIVISSLITSSSEKETTWTKYSWSISDWLKNSSTKPTTTSLTETTKTSQELQDTPPSIPTLAYNKVVEMTSKVGSTCWSISPKDNSHGKAWKDRGKSKSTKKSCKKNSPSQFLILLNPYPKSSKTFSPTLEACISTHNPTINFYSTSFSQWPTVSCSTSMTKTSIG